MDKLYKNIYQLKAWDKNPRNIKPDDFEKLKSKLEIMGQIKPLLVMPDGTVLGGNMRLRAYTELGIDEVWVSTVDFIQKEDQLWHALVNGVEAKKRWTTKDDAMMEYSLLDNDRAGYYDTDMLANLLPNLNIDLDIFNVELTSPESLADLLKKFQPELEITEDEPPKVEEQSPAISQLGEVYQLGRHRLMCGDSVQIDQVETLMAGVKADLLFTDPPYGYSYQSNHQDTHEVLMNDDKILDFIPTAYAVIQDNTPIYIFCGWQTVKQWVEVVEQNSLKLKNIIVWKKNNWSMGDLEGAYAGQYELLLFAHKGRVLLAGGRDRDVWEFDRVPPTDHPTMKPVQLAARAIANHNSNTVLDLFGGSGSTMIACEQLDRTCYMMELDPKYCDVIRKRYSNFIKREDWQEATPAIG